MVTSVNTNVAAMIALQNLTKTNMELQETQGRVSTGLQVAGAKDNSAIYAIAQNMRSEVRGLVAVGQSLSRAISTVDVAMAAAESISDLLLEMKEKAIAAADTSLDADSRSALNEDFKALRDQITTIVINAEFNGTNMVKAAGTDVNAIANGDGTQTVNVAAEDMSVKATATAASVAIIRFTATSSFASATAASATLAQVETSLDNVNIALARLGAGGRQLDIHNVFITKLKDNLTAGIGSLVDADMAVESAKLQALQVKQQLGVQSLSIANRTPQSILGLFQG